MQTILVKESLEDEPESVSADETFIIKQEYSQISSEEFNKWYKILNYADVETTTTVPVYEIAVQHIISNRHGRLHELILLGVCFRRYIDQFDDIKIVCHQGLDDGYQTVIKEVGNGAGFDVYGATYQRSTLKNIVRVVITSICISPFLLDQLFASLVYKFRPKPQRYKISFIPALHRLSSMTPIIEAAEFDTQVLISANFSSLLSTFTITELRKYDPIPVSAYSSLQCIYKQVRSYIVITRSVLFGKQIAAELSNTVGDECQCTFEKTIIYSVWNGLRARAFISFCTYTLFTRLVSQTKIKKIILGTWDPTGVASAQATKDEDGIPFHVPHTIGGRYLPNTPNELVMFLPSHIIHSYYKKHISIENQCKYRVTGRPYLTDVYNRRSEFDRVTNPRPHLLIATQPILHKKEFVQRTLEAVNADQKQWDVTIKIHPNEEPDDYSDISDRFDNVTVQETDLFRNLTNVDLTVTVNSNVGIESIILGTPTVVLNMSKPINFDPLYAEEGPIPSFDTENSFREFIHSINEDEIERLKIEQFDWVRDNYELSSDPTEKILTEIQSYPD